MQNFIKETYLKNLENKKIGVFCEGKICENLTGEIEFFLDKVEEISINSINLSLENIIKLIEKNDGKKEKLLFIKQDFGNFEDIINISKQDFLKETGGKVDLENIFWHINPKILEKFGKFLKKEYLEFFQKILSLIDEKKVKRVHIFTNYEKNFLQEELLTASGAKNTILISNNFEFEKQKVDKNHIDFIEDYIKQNPNIKPRSKEYIEKNIENFYVLKIDDIAIGIFEIKKYSENIMEVGALALSKRWQKRGLGKITNKFIIDSFSEFNQIFVSPNESLIYILLDLGLTEITKKTGNEIFDKRFEKMLEDNRKDGKKRRMLIKKLCG